MQLDPNDLEHGWVTTHSGPWMEECENCMGTGSTTIYDRDNPLHFICEPCEGRGYVEHDCTALEPLEITDLAERVHYEEDRPA